MILRIQRAFRPITVMAKLRSYFPASNFKLPETALALPKTCAQAGDVRKGMLYFSLGRGEGVDLNPLESEPRAITPNPIQRRMPSGPL